MSQMHQINICLKMMFYIFLMCLLTHFTLGNAEEVNTDLTICDGPDWVKFKDEKCFKLIKKWVTRSDASELCSQEMLQIDSLMSQLATIKSQEEQDYLANYIYNVSAVKINVWIGAKRQSSNMFVWDDGSEIEFSNWIDGGPSQSPGRECVEIQNQYGKKLSDASIMNAHDNEGNGKWRDVTCDMPNYVICEKLQRWSFGKLQHSFLVARKQMEDSFEFVSKELSRTQNQLSNIQHNPVPIGFIYVQLPNQPEPKTIWPAVGWSQVTSDYAGQFFRAEGGGSATFGTIQEGDCLKLINVEVQWLQWGQFDASIALAPGQWSKFIRSGGPNTNNNDHNALKFLNSNAEVRPRNQAVRIWKRST